MIRITDISNFEPLTTGQVPTALPPGDQTQQDKGRAVRVDRGLDPEEIWHSPAVKELRRKDSMGNLEEENSKKNGDKVTLAEPMLVAGGPLGMIAAAPEGFRHAPALDMKLSYLVDIPALHRWKGQNLSFLSACKGIRGQLRLKEVLWCSAVVP